MRSKKIYILLAALLLVSCSTQKNTWLSRNYNSLTARYNTLFNGEQSFKQGEQSLIQSNSDNFTHILPIFPYTGPQKAGAVKSEMDRAISKGLKIIQKKSITVRPNKKPNRNNARQEEFYNRREFNRYVDDAFLLIGKSHLYNHDFNNAIAILDYTVREFPGQPSSFEAIIWMARTRIEMGDYENALLLLNQYDAMGIAPNKLYGEYMATYADYYIRTQQYLSAIPFMISAANEAKGKWNKSRRLYILAQLYQQTEQHNNAQATFRKVLRTNPNYEMALNAKINFAMINGMASGNPSSARKDLYKLARQAKNQDQRDRIYHALAQTYLNEKDTIKTITNLQLSAGYNRGNESLKTETYIQLADLYFMLPSYIPAYAYYDSTLTVLPQHDPRQKHITQQHRGLKDLSAQYQTINLEDSLQRLAKMPKDRLDELITAIIEDKRQAQLNQKLGIDSRQDLALGGGMFASNFPGQMGRVGDSQGQWYFYNNATVSLGKMEFERRWGRRPSEDNWRRSDKSTQEPQQLEQPSAIPGDPLFEQKLISEDTQKDDKKSQATDIPTKEELLANIPFDELKMQQSIEKLGDAYFKAGMIFMDHFNDLPKAIEMFSKLTKNIPEHEQAEEAWFWAYMAYMELENQQGAELMKQGLLANFPTGRYAEFARDPKYAENKLKEKTELNIAYENAYDAYKDGNFTSAISLANIIKEKSEDNNLIRKAMLLKAISYGKSGNTKAFEMELELIVADHSQTQEAKMAQTWLAMLKDGKQPAVETKSKTDAISAQDASETKTETALTTISPYKFEPDIAHYIFLVVNENADINRLIFNLADFNFSRFLIGDYDLESHRLPDGQRVVSVGAFNNQREAMDYYYSLRSNPHLFKVDNNNQLMLLAGTKRNREVLTSSGDLTAYRLFFSTNYLRGGGGIVIDLTTVAIETPQAEQTGFTTSTGIHNVVFVTPPRTDYNRVAGFLTGHASNTYQLNVTTKGADLAAGEKLIIVEQFSSADEAMAYIESLSKNAFWNNQIRAGNWTKFHISPNNFQILEEQGSTKNYIEFYNSSTK